MLQGDFVVPSSREAVDNNNAWNQELRSQLPQLFLKALAFFKAVPSEEHLSWVDRWLQCIPLQGEVTHCLSSAPPTCATPLLLQTASSQAYSRV